jgi:hypothetical protein
MGQVLHGSATTTPVVRLAMQNSQESLRAWRNATASIQRRWPSGVAITLLSTGGHAPGLQNRQFIRLR